MAQFISIMTELPAGVTEDAARDAIRKYLGVEPEDVVKEVVRDALESARRD
jgi:hypothetical protein